MLVHPTSGGFSTLKVELGHIRGTVVAGDGMVIAGCKIRILETNHITQSDEQGNFTMINMMPGCYTILAEYTGYSVAIAPNTSIEAGDNPGFRFIINPVAA
jgi:hypothetical protein